MTYICEILIAVLFSLADQVEIKKSIKAITTERDISKNDLHAAAKINQPRALSMCLQFILLCLVVKPYCILFFIYF